MILSTLKCPFCLGQQLGFWTHVVRGDVLLLCDECYTYWRGPHDVSLDSVAGTIVVPHEKRADTIAFEDGQWSSHAEIEHAGWKHYVDGESEALGDG
jgi:hypothetical protein